MDHLKALPGDFRQNMYSGDNNKQPVIKLASFNRFLELMCSKQNDITVEGIVTTGQCRYAEKASHGSNHCDKWGLSYKIKS